MKRIQPHLPIITITGDASLETEKKARAEDIFYYFVKSFDLEEMKKVVKSALSKKTLRQKRTLNSHQEAT